MYVALFSSRVRLSWGEMLNFKCVDYFQVDKFKRFSFQNILVNFHQVQWYDPYNKAATFKSTGMFYFVYVY